MLSVLDVAKGFSWSFFTYWLVRDSLRKKNTKEQMVLVICRSSSQFHICLKYEHFSRRSLPISAKKKTMRTIMSRSWQIWNVDRNSGGAYRERVFIVIATFDPPVGDLSNRSLTVEKSELEGSKMVNSVKIAAVRSSIHSSFSNTPITFNAVRELYPRSAM